MKTRVSFNMASMTGILVITGFFGFLSADRVLAAETQMTAPTSFVTTFLSGIFKTNITERKQNLEKNKDIRNKLIENRQAELTTKLNQGLNTKVTTSSDDRIISDLSGGIDKLTDIKDRLNIRIDTASTTLLDATSTSEMYSRTADAQSALNDARTFLTAFASNPVRDSVSPALVNSKKKALAAVLINMKSAHNYLEEVVIRLSDLEHASSTNEQQ